jgi:hypothetical protein
VPAVTQPVEYLVVDALSWGLYQLRIE